MPNYILTSTEQSRDNTNSLVSIGFHWSRHLSLFQIKLYQIVPTLLLNLMQIEHVVSDDKC